MIIYIIAYIFILFLSLIRTKKNKNKSSTFLLVIWTIFITMVAGFRDMLGGYDSYIYSEIFDIASDEIDRKVPIRENIAIQQNPTELGYGLYNVLIGYITANRYIFLLITSIFTFVLEFINVYRNSRYPAFTFFILFCIWYFFSFAYLRQVIAANICWLAIPYAIEKKPWKFFLIVGLAATFHNSALLFCALYFISDKYFTKQQIVQYTIISLLIGLTPIGSILFNIIGGAINESKAEQSLAGENDGRIAYIIEAFFFLWIIYSNYEKIAKNKLSICMLNISLLFIFVLTFFVRFSDGGRMSWFFLIGIASTVAQICLKGKKTSNTKIISLIVISTLYFRILFAWGILLTPYKTFFTDGVRDGDWIWEFHEYDHNYDDDKLYRPPLKIFK